MTTIAVSTRLLPTEFTVPPLNAPIIARPVAGIRVPAGFPLPSEDFRESELDPNSFLIRSPNSTFFFRVVGDSMQNAYIHDGDYLVVERGPYPKHNQIVIAEVNGEYTVKRLYKRGGKVELRPENPAYQPIQFADGDCLEIWGIVIGVFRRIGD